MAITSRRSIKHTGLLALLVGLCLALTACGPSITVNMVDPVERTLSNETISLRNCGCDDDLVSDTGLEVKFDIDEYALSASQAERVLIPEDTMAELAVELEKAYEPVVEQIRAMMGDFQLTVPPDKIRTFQIQWKGQEYSSTISFRMGLKAYTTAYTCQFNIPNEISYSEISCTA
jgi:hypothetical protein